MHPRISKKRSVVNAFFSNPAVMDANELLRRAGGGDEGEGTHLTFGDQTCFSMISPITEKWFIVEQKGLKFSPPLPNPSWEPIFHEAQF